MVGICMVRVLDLTFLFTIVPPPKWQVREDDPSFIDRQYMSGSEGFARIGFLIWPQK